MSQSKLILVPTPIGNLDDITLRAIKVLQQCDMVLAEDTCVSRFLLKHLGIEKKIQSFHSNNEHHVLERTVNLIRENNMVALVSDAGTPAISDPGFLLVRACIAANIEVETLPGPTAFVPALVNSGFPCDRFCFEGFLPHKKGRVTRITEWQTEERTIILYESPHRLIKTLQQMNDILISVCEMKFSEAPLTIDKSYAAELRQKRDTLRRITGTRKIIFLTMVTTFGFADSPYAKELVTNSVLADELVRE